MKIAFLWEDNAEQLVLTPETEWERQALKMLDGKQMVSFHRGTYYHCQGGWKRHWTSEWGQSSDDDSTIIRLEKSV